MVEYSERLKQAMGTAVTVPMLSKAIGISYQAVKAVVDGKTTALTAENNSKAARFLGVNPDWLATGEGPMKSTQAEAMDLDNHPNLVSVRSVKLRLQAGVTGFSIEAEQSDGQPIFFRADWLQEKGYKPYQLVAVKVHGNSMEPTLYQGDMVVVNTADTEPKDGRVFAVNYEGEAVIKRMVRDGGTWWLSSDNPDQRRFPRKECTEGSCLIVGMVIHRQSEHI